MGERFPPNDLFQLYMSEITSRVVAKSGIPTDRFHLGKLILQGLNDAPDFVSQIDAGTGESETNGSVLERSIRCSISLKAMGLEKGDVMVLMAPNHLDLAIPLYAALYLGVIVAPVDRTFKADELQSTFAISQPKIVFCQSEKALDIQLTLNKLALQCKIITFDKGNEYTCFSKLLEKYKDTTTIKKFVPENFDAEETIACLVSTSGTTGFPKATASTHKNFAVAVPYRWARQTTFPTPTRSHLFCSALQWSSTLGRTIFCPILRVTRVQSSLPIVKDHIYYMINKYKPTSATFSTTLLTALFKEGDRNKCDFTNLEVIYVGGIAVPIGLIKTAKEIAPNAEIYNTFGISELSSVIFDSTETGAGSVGRLVGWLQYRLIDINTQVDITEPNKKGELWLKGPGLCKGYYRNAEATAKAFVDGWFKTGDIFYRDRSWNFFFVDRIKFVIEYNNYPISPLEVETVIRTHPGVLDVAVTSVPDDDHGELPVACVVTQPNCEVSAIEIQNLVKDTLVNEKQLRGGVIFLNELPIMPSTKVNRKELMALALRLKGKS